MTDPQFFDPTPKIVYRLTKVICPKHGTHEHTIHSAIQGHKGHWCMICALEKLGEPLPTTDYD